MHTGLAKLISELTDCISKTKPSDGENHLEIIRQYLFTDIRHWLIFTPSQPSPHIGTDSEGPQRAWPLFNNQRNTNKDGTASTATGDQIAPKGYQREDHLDG
jgi:hypothetical protein